MKVYIVMLYGIKGHSIVEGVYSNPQSAKERVDRFFENEEWKDSILVNAGIQEWEVKDTSSVGYTEKALKENVDIYMGAFWEIEITPIPEDEGGGFMASIPSLGRYRFCADGETVFEAIRNLEKVCREGFADYLKKGIFPEMKSNKK